MVQRASILTRGQQRKIGKEDFNLAQILVSICEGLASPVQSVRVRAGASSAFVGSFSAIDRKDPSKIESYSRDQNLTGRLRKHTD